MKRARIHTPWGNDIEFDYSLIEQIDREPVDYMAINKFNEEILRIYGNLDVKNLKELKDE